MPFVADDLGAWLVGLLADAGRKRLTELVLGTDQERALRSAATTAVLATARELSPGGGERAEELAMVVSEVFGSPVPELLPGGHATVLEALREGIAGQLAPLGDASLTGTGQSSADLFGVEVTALAETLSTELLRQILARGARGGPLSPLASQLNHDLARVDRKELKGMVGEALEALGRLAGAHPAAAAPTALAQLPPPVTGFTGRDDELAVFTGLLDPAGSGPVMVAAVAGLAGVGKTTLAVQAGHAARRRGWFAGGVVFLDLHGYDEAPVEPRQALDALLRALGVPAEHIPPTLEERTGLYRSVLAEIGDPVLLIADNASSEGQVRPLLPGTGRHKVLVTSRHTLAGLDARLVDITVLDEDAAVGLLDAALRAARPDDDRITESAEAGYRLAAVCGGLPLALQITAALLKADPMLAAAELADELAVEHERLERLRYDDGSGPGAPSVAAAFELSYRRLEETPARVFRLLPVSPGPDVSTDAAAVLADLPVREVRAVLAGLARAHLAEAAAGVAGRWRMHDLLRLYAERLSEDNAEADGREQARDRVLGYYLTMAGAANDHLQALSGTTLPEEFTGWDDALAWMDLERINMVAAITMAADTGRDEPALRLPLRMAHYLSWRRRFDDMLATIAISVDAARRLGDPLNEAVALTILGNALAELRRLDEAIAAHQDAVAIFRESGDLRGAVMALGNLGVALHDGRRFEEAIAVSQDALAIFREIGDRHSEAMALGNLGRALLQVWRFEEAAAARQDAAAIFRETGDRHGEGTALDGLGPALRELRRFEEAVAAHQDAAAIFRETGDLHREGGALGNLGLALLQARRFEEAVAALQGAAAIFRETGELDSERMALDDLEAARAAQGA